MIKQETRDEETSRGMKERLNEKMLKEMTRRWMRSKSIVSWSYIRCSLILSWKAHCQSLRKESSSERTFRAECKKDNEKRISFEFYERSRRPWKDQQHETLRSKSSSETPWLVYSFSLLNTVVESLVLSPSSQRTKMNNLVCRVSFFPSAFCHRCPHLLRHLNCLFPVHIKISHTKLIDHSSNVWPRLDQLAWHENEMWVRFLSELNSCRRWTETTIVWEKSKCHTRTHVVIVIGGEYTR